MNTKSLLAAPAVAALLAGLAVVAPAAAAGDRTSARATGLATVITPNGNWPVYHHDDGHTGYDSTVPTASTATPGWVSAAFDQTVYSSPLVYQGIVYVATLNNTVYALNQTDGTLIWSTHIRAPETTGWQCGNVSPQGIVGTPVVDPSTGRIYVVTLDGTDDLYRVEGLNLTTGVVELTTVITTQAVGFNWTIQQERGAIAVRNGYVYVPFGGRANDCGAYHGWVFAVPTNGGAALPPYVTPGQGAGFWTAGGVVVDDSTGKVFATSGNGTSSGCNANPDGSPVYENDAVVRLSATVVHEDAFFPYDWHDHWCINDQDLGSASMVLISSTLAFQSGKWGSGFLINPQNLGGWNGQRYPPPSPATYTPVDACNGLSSEANFGSYAYAAPYVYLSCQGKGMVAVKVDTAAPSFSACDATCGAPSWIAPGFTPGPPIVAGGAVWTVDIGGAGLYGLNAATGAQIYHSAGFGVTHFTTLAEAGGQIFAVSDATSTTSMLRSFDMVTGCKSVTVSVSPASPSPVGTPVSVTGTASGCPNANPLYQFWLLPPGGAWSVVRSYGTGATFDWDTAGKAPGTYLFSVWARDASSPASYDAFDSTHSYTLTLATCTAVGVAYSPVSPSTVGTPVTVTGTASGCPNPRYLFWLLPPGGSWSVVQPYSAGATYSWTTSGRAAGTYLFSVWARDAASTAGYDAYNSSQSYALTLTPCTAVGVSYSPASPSNVGTPVTVTGAASGCPNARYQFWFLPPGGTWSVVQGYGPSAAYSWNTTGRAPGIYLFSVWARDAGSSASYDAYNSTQSYTLTVAPCAAVVASYSPASPSAAGTQVTVTGAASGCPNARYEFWYLPPGGTWTLVQGYSASPTYSWNTTGNARGTYLFSVWARDASSAAGYDAFDSSHNYALTITPCTAVSVSYAPASPSSVGTPVTVTGTASGCPNARYQFWFLPPGGTWTLVQAYSASATYNWNTAGKTPGTYLFSVWARDASSSASYDAYDSTHYFTLQ